MEKKNELFPYGQGSRIIWVLHFNPDRTDLPHEQSVELYIPLPAGYKQSWMPVHPAMGAQAAEFLNRIQQICEKIKDECAEAKDQPQAAEYIQKAKEVEHTLKNLEELIRKFNEIMQRLNKPLPPDLYST